jgi:Mg-chelatase subunit ChlD
MLKQFQTILLILSLSTLLQAKTFKGEVESSGNAGCQTLTQKESPYIESLCVDKIKVKYKLYSMMGEPVEVFAVYWELSPIINLRSGSVSVATLPVKVQEAYAKVSLHYKSKFIIDLHQSQQYRTSFRFSGGALKGSGRGYSFDTPGSPSWDKYMLKSDSGNTYYSKKEAIAIFKSIPEHAASFSFNKIENLAFSNLYSLNSALKPKKEKKKHEKKQTKKEDTAKQNTQTQQNTAAKENTANSNSMINAFNTTSQTTQMNTNIQSSPAAPVMNKQVIKQQNTNYAYTGTVSASLLLLIDISGSMSGAKLKSAKQAAMETIATSLKKGVEIAILAFSGNCGNPISKRIDFTTNKQSLKSFMNSLSASGGTPLGNALKIANNYLYQSKAAASQTQMIILLADGDDNCGNINSVMANLKNKGIIFRHQTIGLEVSSNSKAARQLQSIATRSGGVYHHVKDHKQLPNIFKEALGTMEILDMLGSFGSPQTNTAKKPHAPSSTQTILDGF